jgi:hypothetical protein
MSRAQLPLLIVRVALVLLAAVTLSVAFNAYRRPEFIIDIANRLLLCT